MEVDGVCVIPRLFFYLFAFTANKAMVTKLGTEIHLGHSTSVCVSEVTRSKISRLQDRSIKISFGP